jgi:hypothetical protein
MAELSKYKFCIFVDQEVLLFLFIAFVTAGRKA